MKTASLGEAAKLFLEWHRFEHRDSSTSRITYCLAALARHLGEETALTAIQAKDLEAYKAARAAAGIKPVTIRHDLHALSALIRYAQMRGWIDHNPLHGVKIPSDRYAVRIHPLSADEERVYLAAAAARATLRSIAVLMLGTGIRPGEALALRVADVDANQRVLHVRDGKTPAARRAIRLVGEAWETARAASSGRNGSAWLFPERDPTYPLIKISQAHRRICDRAGLTFCLYDLRHTFATRMAERGMPLTTLASILGHAGLRCVMRYIHPGQQTMNEAMERFAKS